MAESRERAVIFQRRLPMDLKLISPIQTKVSSDAALEQKLEEEVLNRMKEGYILMGKLNIEMSEIGFNCDCKDLMKYERSLLRKGIF